MKATAICSICLALITSALADDPVTIPKSRLEELERKEAELEKLKGDLNKTKGENLQLKQQHETDTARLAQVPTNAPPPYVSPPLASLPPFSEGQTIVAMDLANYYRTDAVAADQRFGNRQLKVQGEIAGFEVMPFTRIYRLLLKTPNRETKVVCSFTRLEKYNAVIVTDHGEKLVGLLPNNGRVPLATVDQTVVIEGHCDGLAGSEVKLSRCVLK